MGGRFWPLSYGVDGPELPIIDTYNQGLPLTEKFQSENVKGPLVHKRPMTYELLDHNEKLLSLATS